MKTLISDLDGTLFSTSDFLESALRAAVKGMITAGLPANSEQEVCDRLLRIREKNSNSANHFNLLCQDYDINWRCITRIVEAGRIEYHNTKFSLLKPRENVINALEYCKANNIKLAVLTKGFAEKQYEKIIRMGLMEYFLHRAGDRNQIIRDYVYVTEEDDKAKLFDDVVNDLQAKKEEVFTISDRLDDVFYAHQAGLNKNIHLNLGKYKGETPVSMLLKRNIDEKKLMKPSNELERMKKSYKPEYEVTNWLEVITILKE